MTTQTTPEIEVLHDGDAPVPEPEAYAEPSSAAAATHAPGAAPAAEEEPVQLVPVEVVQAVVTAGFAAVAERRGEHWTITPDEAHNIAEPVAGELEDLARLLPFLGGAADALGSRRMRLAAALAWTITPRLVLDVMSPREQAEPPPAKVTPIRAAANDTPARSGELESYATDGDALAADLAGLPPRD